MAGQSKYGNRQGNQRSEGSGSDDTDRTLLAEMPIARDMLRINRAIFSQSNKPTIDIRRWWLNDEDVWSLGKGLNIPISKWPAFVELVAKADQALREQFIEEIASSGGAGSQMDLSGD